VTLRRVVVPEHGLDLGADLAHLRDEALWW